MRTKKLYIFFLLFFSQISFAQKIDLCRYFSIQIRESEYIGKISLGKSFAISKDLKDPFGKLLKKHSLRYDYILFKSGFLFDSNYALMHPHKEKIDSFFCQSMKSNVTFNQHFSYLSDPQYATQQLSSMQFTQTEMMLAASRFFYCDKIEKEDTGIGYHICVGINGIKEIESQKDLTVLEAFCIEGIFDAMNHKKEAAFIKDFSNNIQKSKAERKKHFNDFNELLLGVRKDCFNEMEQNENLKKSLLAYYQKNKSTINFTIQ